jgi:hypothetical protein
MQLNYLWPQYSLPWNNFIGRVQPNPYYLANQLRNITIRAIESPLIFDSHVVVASASIWQNIMSTDSSVVTSSASKVFVGKYVDMANNIAGLQFPLGSLVDDARTTRARLDELVSNSDEHIAMVRQLETQVDAIIDTTPSGPLPTGDDLAAELERFLREQE